ncbi:unnamed protein product [Diatraea saccharalis]|uniref:N-acetyltransferase domain-containing protein n=1 Tax=Diatraea saccharalis TaxID=40085 RepID=A0A9N9QZR5_9NEOP|nr:unnamed protein product [Diatraea saccharalis]
MEKSKCRVYSRFTVTRSDGSTVKLRIQDMPLEYLDAVVDMHSEYFTKDEPYHRAAGVYKSEHAKAESRELMKTALEHLQSHVDICCVDDDPDVIGELAGVSATHITNKTMDLGDIQNVEKFYDDLFILVHPDFRRLGIAKEFVKNRRTVCKLENIAVTASWMSSWGTQKAGEQDGWQTVVVLCNEEIGKRFDVVFEDAPPTNKYMLTRVDQ